MKTKNLIVNLVITAGIILSAQGCTNTSRQNEDQEETNMEMGLEEKSAPMTVQKAICILHPTEGYEVNGTVTFTQQGNDVKIVADIKGLTPGKHGFHIHELGDCSAPDGTSAGGHFNPENTKHGAPSDSERHAGDLGNIEAGDDGTAHLEMTDSMIQLNGEHSIIGRAIIVHAGEDDFTSQPTGDAGARVACGVIGIDE